MTKGAVIEFPLNHLLPYDGEVVAQAMGVEGVVLPQKRCIEDRPEDNTSVKHVSAKKIIAGGPNVIDLAAKEGFETGIWILAPHLGKLATNTATITIPERLPESEFWTPEGMIQSAQENGLSLPGGLYGAAIARALGMEMTKRGSFIDLGLSLDVLARTIGHIAPELGRLHENCKARDAAGDILKFLVEESDTALATGLETAPWARQDQFTKLIDAARRLKASGAVHERHELPQRPLKKQKDDPTAVVPHAGEYVIAINNSRGHNVLWNTRQAWEAGQAAYALNVALYYEANLGVQQRLNGFLGRVAIEHTTTALIGYQGATINNLPKRQDGHAPQVLYVDGKQITAGELRK